MMMVVEARNRGLSILEIVIAIAILGSMSIWIIQTLTGTYRQSIHTEDHTQAALAASSVMARVIDCIRAEPRFFSPQRLVELEIIPDPDGGPTFEHRGLFVDQDTSTMNLPASWQNLHRSNLFTAAIGTGTADPAAGTIMTGSGLSALAFRLVIGNEFDTSFEDGGASALCKHVRVEVYRLRDLAAGTQRAIFRMARSFAAPSMSLEPEEINLVHAQVAQNDLDKAIQDVLGVIKPSMTHLDSYPEIQRFIAALTLIAVEMNRLHYDLHGSAMTNVPLPLSLAENTSFPSLIAQIEQYEPPASGSPPVLPPPDTTLKGMIHRATLHRRAASRILEAHKRCLPPAREVQRLVNDSRVQIDDFLRLHRAAYDDLRAAMADADAHLAALKALPADDGSGNAVMAASGASVIRTLARRANAWDQLFADSDNLRLLKLTNLFSSSLKNMVQPLLLLKELPTRYLRHLRHARNRYYDLLGPTYADEPQLTPQSLQVFANYALEAQAALALVGADTDNVNRLLATIQANHRLQIESPLLFRDYWNDLTDVVAGLRSDSPKHNSVFVQDFQSRNASYTRHVIPSLWGLADFPASITRDFDGPAMTERILRAVQDDLAKTRFEAYDWNIGGFIETTFLNINQPAAKLGELDTALYGQPTIRTEVLANLSGDQDIVEMLTVPTKRITCPNLRAVLDQATSAENG